MSLMYSCSRIVALLGPVIALSIGSQSRAATISLGSNGDTYLRDATARGGLAFMDVRGATIDFRGYLRFDLSPVAGNTITSANLVLSVAGGASRNDAVNGGRFALYGLNNDVGNTSQNWDEATLVPATKGAENVDTLTGVTDLDDNVAGVSESLNPSGGSANVGTTVTISGTPLVSFLQGRLGDSGLATFVLSNDDATDRGYGLGTKENATESLRPVLTLEYEPVPEPSAIAIAIAPFVWAMGLRRRERRQRANDLKRMARSTTSF